MIKKPSIGVLGLWHLGCVYSTSLAELGYKVTGYDLNDKTVNLLKIGTPPIFEPEMTEKLNGSLNKNLFFTSRPAQAIKGKKYIFITLDVPVDDHDRMDLKPLDKLFSMVCRYASHHTTVIISSQVPLGTCRKLLNRLSRRIRANVIYFPENIRLGSAYQTFLNPDRIVLGIENETLLKQFSNDFPNFICPILPMSLESAEMVKHALNSYLAVCISYASEIGDLCELLGANYDDVSNALKTDSRISSHAPLNPGTGFAGGTIGRDVQALKALSKTYHHLPRLIDTAYKINKNRLKKVLNKIQSVYPNLRGKRVGILGLTYKPGTNTLRRSKSLELSKLLYRKETNLVGYDPAMKESIIGYPYIRISRNLNDFFTDLDAVVIMTPCPEFKQITISQLSKMKNQVLFDTVNFLDKNVFTSKKIKYFRTGQ